MKNPHRGFTLIELMITVAIVAILVAVALPSYRSYVRTTHRSEAQAFMLAVASRQQQFLVDTRSYVDTIAEVGVPMPSNVAAAYTVTDNTLHMTTSPAAFYLELVPTSDQASEKCGTLRIDQTGAKTAAVAGCW
ncbi:type IV pilin protein [Piscinibacter sp.]|uniref:type IV pilin protein n=1 Tax=Piscinibacter sp. TaxID=1903157 RepID=UPI002C3A567B|nr:type IV pilin protein [Albitalea sp.]HUG22268.1 type IV pilin protein [Albitalea sp.]